jgi:hypothetical protein
LRRKTKGAQDDDEIDLQPDEIGRDSGRAIVAGFRPAQVDPDGAVLDPAEFAQPARNSTGFSKATSMLPSTVTLMITTLRPSRRAAD